MTNLPPPDPEQGAAAESQAAEARASALEALTEGAITLQDLFARVVAEEPHRQLGHIHVRAALLSLPHIGEKRADEILDALGIPPHRHLDAIGTRERELVYEAISKYEPTA